MGKTNHRVNKDREEKLGEALAHKKRRKAHAQLDLFVEQYNHDTVDMYADEFFEIEEERFEKIRRHG